MSIKAYQNTYLLYNKLLVEFFTILVIFVNVLNTTKHFDRGGGWGGA